MLFNQKYYQLSRVNAITNLIIIYRILYILYNVEFQDFSYTQTLVEVNFHHCYLTNLAQ